jgi:guanylate kinase
MIILCGASASGKSEICKSLCFNFGYVKFVTTTTRAKRIGEVDGVDYNFISIEDFERKIKNNEFIEYVQYNNNYYGTEKKSIADNVVLIIEPNGLRKFMQLNDPHIISFFLICDEEVRRQRMINRLDKKADIEARIKNDKINFLIPEDTKLDFLINTSEDSTLTYAQNINKLYCDKLASLKK